MMRALGLLVGPTLALILTVVCPAWSLTQEEVLQRRLDRMRQAEPELREAERIRQEQANQPETKEPVRSSKAFESLPIPDPVRVQSGPSPEPRQNLWDKRQAATQTGATAPSSTAPSAAAPPPAVAAPPASAVPPAVPAPAPAASQGTPSPAPAPAPVPAAKRDAKTAAALAAKAAKAAKAGDYKTALARLNEAVDADPTDPELLNNRGNVLVNAGSPREALADYDRAIGMKPTDSAFFTNRGFAHERLGNQGQACSDYKRACDLGDCEFYKSFKTEGHCR